MAAWQKANRPRKKGRGQVRDERSDRKEEAMEAMMGLRIRSEDFDNASIVDSYLDSRNLLRLMEAHWLQTNGR